MENKNDHWFRNTVRAVVILAALGSFSLAQAQAVTSGLYYDRFVTSGGTTVASGPNRVVTAEGAKAANGQTIWDKAVKTDGGLPKIEGTAGMPSPSGARVPVSASARMPAPEVAKAIGRSIGRVAGKLLVPLVIGNELYDLGKELGFDLSRKPDGSIDVSKKDPQLCTVSPCTGYYYASNPTEVYGGLSAACSSAVAFQNSVANDPYTYRMDSLRTSPPGCFVSYRTDSGTQFISGGAFSIATKTVAPVPSDIVPSTQQEFIDAVAAKPGWPSTSRVNEVLRKDLEAAGNPSTGPLTVTGPATSTGPKTTTVNTTNNTTRTDTTTYNYNYAGDTVTTSTVINSVTINNTSGDTISNTTTTTQNQPAAEETPKCPKGDESAGCAQLDTPDLDIPRETKTITYSEENVFGSGSCPANLTASVGTLGSTVTVWDWEKTCAAAIPLRALVLALASFAALLIVMPGRVET